MHHPAIQCTEPEEVGEREGGKKGEGGGEAGEGKRRDREREVGERGERGIHVAVVQCHISIPPHALCYLPLGWCVQLCLFCHQFEHMFPGGHDPAGKQHPGTTKSLITIAKHTIRGKEDVRVRRARGSSE